MFEKKITEVDKKAMDKAAKKNKQKKTKEKGSVGMIVKSILIPLILAAVVVCVIYLVMQNQAKMEIIKAPVVCVTEDITKNTLIAADEVDQYFEVKDVEAAILPTNIYNSLKELPEGGFYVEEDMTKNQMVYKGDLCKTDEVMDKYVDGTQHTSLKVNSFDNSVSGTLRHGDIVDVYAVDPSTDQLVLMVEDVYVEAAFDSSGNQITPEFEAENGTATAVVFTIKVAPDEKEQMNLAISYEGIQLYLSNK